MFCSISCFFNEFSLEKVTKFAGFVNKNRAGKICNARGRLLGDYGPLINQSERAYYLSHIINRNKTIILRLASLLVRYLLKQLFTSVSVNSGK